jgi:hypothetical protein
MKTTTRMMTMVVFAVGLLGIHNALAQSDYDAKTVETIGGKVLSIEKTTPEKRRGYWIDVMLQIEKQTIGVQLGFLERIAPASRKKLGLFP